MIYDKNPLSLDDQIGQLTKRGLLISNSDLAKEYLITIGYYRLSGYWWSMQSDTENHIFKPNSTFENIISIYNFDRELRLLLFDIIEKIEIAMRTKMIYYLSHEISPWWFEEGSIFKNERSFQSNLKSIDRELDFTKENFIKKHYEKYSSDTRRPPAWKTLNVISFGTLSKLYGNLIDAVDSKDIISSDFGTVNKKYLPSWLQSISQIRNICAHHGRIWNKNLPGRPKLLPNPPYKWINNVPDVNERHKLYIQICCMKYMIDRVDVTNHIKERLVTLFNMYPNIDQNALGFDKNWLTEPLWR